MIAHDELPLSAQLERFIDEALHNEAYVMPYACPHRHIGQGVVTHEKGWWMLMDKTIGRPFYAHA